MRGFPLGSVSGRDPRKADRALRSGIRPRGSVGSRRRILARSRPFRYPSPCSPRSMARLPASRDDRPASIIRYDLAPPIRSIGGDGTHASLPLRSPARHKPSPRSSVIGSLSHRLVQPSMNTARVRSPTPPHSPTPVGSPARQCPLVRLSLARISSPIVAAECAPRGMHPRPTEEMRQ